MARRDTMRRWVVCLATMSVMTWSTHAAPRLPMTAKKPARDALPKTSRDAAVRLVRDETSPARKREAKIRRKLTRRISFELKDQEIGAALKQVAKVGGFDMVFDPEAVAAGDLTLDVDVYSIKFEQTSIRRIIDYILDQHADVEIKFLTQDGVMKIVTREKADSIQNIRVYSVATLRKAMVPVGRESTLGGTAVGQRTPQITFEGEDELLDVIRSSTSGLWEEDDPDLGGSIIEFGDLLAIRQTQAVLEEIEDLIRGLEIAARNELNNGAFQVRRPGYDHAADNAIRETLRKTISVKFADATLMEALEELRQKTGIYFVADPEAVAAGDLALDAIIDLNLESSSVRSVLKLMLEQHADVELDFLVDEGIVTLVTMEKADSVDFISIYDVGDFLGTEFDSDTLISVIKRQTSGIWVEDDPDLGGAMQKIENFGVIVVRQTRHVHLEIAQVLTRLRSERKKAGLPTVGQAKAVTESDGTFVTRFYSFAFNERAESVRESLEKFVAPETWADKKSEVAVSVVEGTLIIRHTVKTHRQIREFLRKLGKGPRKTGDNFVTQFYPFVFTDRANEVKASLMKFVAQDTWTAKNTEAAISIVEGTLVIRHTVKTHRKIREFLRRLDNADGFGTQPFRGGFSGGGGLGAPGF